MTSQVKTNKQITLDGRTPRYYTDMMYRLVMDEIQQCPLTCNGNHGKIREGKQFGVRDLKKGAVQQFYEYRDFGWLNPDLAKEVSKKLNERGYHTIILKEQGGMGISGIDRVILVEEVDK